MLLEDTDVKAAVAAALKKDPTALPGWWDEIIAAAHVSGFADVQEGLLRRGFTAAQIATWDRAAEFERKQSLYHALLNGGGLESFDLTGVRLYDQRKELERIQVYSGGVFVVPANAASGPGTVGYGEPEGGLPDPQFPPSGDFQW